MGPSFLLGPLLPVNLIPKPHLTEQHLVKNSYCSRSFYFVKPTFFLTVLIEIINLFFRLLVRGKQRARTPVCADLHFRGDTKADGNSKGIHN
jgi:hypothetical protein